jgi:putative SOS response-associated peptidase YedK
MCGRFTASDPRQLALRFGLPALAELAPRFNIAPTQPVPVITMDRTLVIARWGLVPKFAKDLSIGARMINARAETLESRPPFRDALRGRRCLVPADGFFEWRKEGKARRPYWLRLSGGKPFAFAGLWDVWRAPDGQEVPSVAIITTEPNALVAPIHDRMPVILRPEAEARWLDPAVQDLSDLVDVLQPHPSHEMEAIEVNSAVNSVANDDPRCVTPVGHSQQSHSS